MEFAGGIGSSSAGLFIPMSWPSIVAVPLALKAPLLNVGNDFIRNAPQPALTGPERTRQQGSSKATKATRRSRVGIDPNRQLGKRSRNRRGSGLTTYQPVGMILDMKGSHHPEATRERILQAGFEEFYRHGFQGGSLNRIVEEAGLTKGAVFHHFAGKHELGYAVVDEVIWPHFKATWIDPLEQTDDPIGHIRRLIVDTAEKGGPGGSLTQGCPLNNLAQEMSPLDEEFRQRLERIYAAWRRAFKSALANGIKGGKVRKGVSPEKVAAFLVAALTGIIGTVKNAQDQELLTQAGGGLLDYLESMRP
jgi:AcrR family transcriptional regulator